MDVKLTKSPNLGGGRQNIHTFLGVVETVHVYETYI
jgi:hypothetical protein